MEKAKNSVNNVLEFLYNKKLRINILFLHIILVVVDNKDVHTNIIRKYVGRICFDCNFQLSYVLWIAKHFKTRFCYNYKYNIYRCIHCLF